MLPDPGPVFRRHEFFGGRADRVGPVYVGQLRKQGVGERDLAVLNHVDGFLRVVDQQAVLLFAFLKSLFRPLVVGDVQIGAQHADDVALGVAQRDFAGQQREGPPVGRGLGFLDQQFGATALDDLPIVGAVCFRLFPPAHLEVVFADDVLRGGEPRIARKRRVAAEVREIPVFPEHPRGNGVDDAFDHLRGIAQVFFRPFLVGDRLAQLEVAVAQIGDLRGEPDAEGHGSVDFFPAPARHAVEGGEIVRFVESIPAGLGAEKFHVRLLVVEEELAEEEVAHVPFADDDGRSHVPEAVLAAVELEGSGGDAIGKSDVAFQAVPAGLGMDAMEFRADVLPARGDQHPAAEIDDGHGDVLEGEKRVHHGLEGFHVEDVGRFCRAALRRRRRQRRTGLDCFFHLHVSHDGRFWTAGTRFIDH